MTLKLVELYFFHKPMGLWGVHCWCPLSPFAHFIVNNNKTWEVPHTTPTFKMLFTLLYSILQFFYDFYAKIKKKFIKIRFYKKNV